MSVPLASSSGARCEKIRTPAENVCAECVQRVDTPTSLLALAATLIKQSRPPLADIAAEAAKFSDHMIVCLDPLVNFTVVIYSEIRHTVFTGFAISNQNVICVGTPQVCDVIFLLRR